MTCQALEDVRLLASQNGATVRVVNKLAMLALKNAGIDG